MVKQWQLFNLKYKTSLYICISSALRRGVINKKEAKNFSVFNFNLQSGFELVGLTTMADKLLKCDRIIQF